jgi:DTW domain-containing protein YfiP
LSLARAARQCPRCLRAACICACLQQPGVPVACAVELLILQHPREQREPKGTARLLHLAVAGSRLLVGEHWPRAPDEPGSTVPRRDLLLYPPTPDAVGLAAPPPLDAAWLQSPHLLRLVVIDGTWRKALRMLHESAWLQSLPRCSLAAPPASRYAAIRRARGLQQRSTFEAAVLGLQTLVAEPESLAPLWPVFDAFVRALGNGRPQGQSGPTTQSG